MGFKEDRLRIRAYVSNIKINTPCQDCCQYFPEEAVDFDHVHGFKIDSISNMVNYSDLETIKKEIEKCEIRCANCHRIATRERKLDEFLDQAMAFDIEKEINMK